MRLPSARIARIAACPEARFDDRELQLTRVEDVLAEIALSHHRDWARGGA